MDFVDGQSLERHPGRRAGALPVDEALEIARQIAPALAAAHERRRRAPRPEAGQRAGRRRAARPTSPISASRARSAAPASPRPARSSARRNTCRRSRRAARTSTTARDLYALGLMMYEMLTGELPFRGGTPAEMLAARSAGRPQRIAGTHVAVPPWLEHVIERCLASDPADRYADAAALDGGSRGGQGEPPLVAACIGEMGGGRGRRYRHRRRGLVVPARRRDAGGGPAAERRRKSRCCRSPRSRTSPIRLAVDGPGRDARAGTRGESRAPGRRHAAGAAHLRGPASRAGTTRRA